jgi:hypothetical protein
MTQKQLAHTEPETVRRKLAAELRKLATEKRFTKATRAEYLRMAEQWEKTLPEKI